MFLVVFRSISFQYNLSEKGKSCVKLKQVLVRMMMLVFYYYYDTLFGHYNIKQSKLLSWSLVLSLSSGKTQKEI
jgi:hypothetical protein